MKDHLRQDAYKPDDRIGRRYHLRQVAYYLISGRDEYIAQDGMLIKLMTGRDEVIT